MAESNNQDILIRVYATLSSLRKNISQINYGIEEKYVNQYHEALDRLQSIGIDVTEFRIPHSEVRPRSTGGSYITGETFYSEEKYIDKPVILIKLDAVLSYFEIITAERPKNIGFRQSDG